MESELYGTNLCNILVNEIIKEFNKIDKNHITDVVLCDLSEFIILRGKTTVQNPPNYSHIFNSFIDELTEKKRTFNVIDLILYNTIPNNQIIDIDISFTTDIISDSLINTFPLFGEYEFEHSISVIKHNNQEIYERLTEITEFKDYHGVTIDSYKPFYSTDFFGKNLMSSKSYVIYLKYIAYNLFEKQLCKDIRFKLFYTGNINDLNWETMLFDIKSSSNIPNIDWIKSCILDLFDFNYSHIKKHLSLEEYDFNREILSNDKCWKIRDKTKDMILL